MTWRVNQRRRLDIALAYCDIEWVEEQTCNSFHMTWRESESKKKKINSQNPSPIMTRYSGRECWVRRNRFVKRLPVTFSLLPGPRILIMICNKFWKWTLQVFIYSRAQTLHRTAPKLQTELDWCWKKWLSYFSKKKHSYSNCGTKNKIEFFHLKEHR